MAGVHVGPLAVRRKRILNGTGPVPLLAARRASAIYVQVFRGGIVLYSSRRGRRGGSHYQAPAQS